MKPIVLFDMDGTLTNAREKINWSTVVKMRELQQYADLGIVSGSPYEYIQYQMGLAWQEINSLVPSRLIIMPCNGTQVYTFNTDSGRPAYTKTYNSNMIDALGKSTYRILLSILTDLQNQTIENNVDIPLSGNFISFRGSMVNWCMIGRDADHNMRNEFSKQDAAKSIRKHLKDKLDFELATARIQNIITALGGSTSIDIYPEGWDKTYCLRHLDPSQAVYFVGDRCQGSGNDRELFEHSRTNAYETSGPHETISIIDDIISVISNG